MKKVLMIGMTVDVGGIETYIMNLFRQLGKDYTFYFPYVDHIAYEDEIKQAGGIFLYDLPISRRNPLTYYQNWKKAFEKYRFDVVYFNNCDIVSLDILKIAKKQNVPVRIFHAHNSSNTLQTDWMHRLEEKHSRRISKTVITDMLACSKNAGDYMFGGLPYLEIKNGIDTDKFAFDEAIRKKKRKEFGLSEEQKVILFVGRFTDIKNPLFALDVIRDCHQINPAFAGLICGDGGLAEAVEKKVQEEKLSEYVQLLGNRADINKIYSAADFLIMPSLFEGFPFVLVEAECSGLKCICSTNVEKNTNLVGTVEYFPLEEGSENWAKKIVETISDTAHRPLFREKIVAAGYDMEKTAQQVKTIFESK